MKKEDLKKGLEIDEKIRDIDKSIEKAELVSSEVKNKGICSFTISQGVLNNHTLNIPEEVVNKIMNDYIKLSKAEKIKLEKEFNDI